MINKRNTINIHLQNSIILGSLLICSQPVFSAPLDNLKAVAAISYNSEDTVAPSLGNIHTNSSHNSKATILHGKAELTEQVDNNIQAWQASQVYKEGVKALSAKDYNLAAQFFKIAGDGFATAGGNEKFLAESRYAEGQSRRLLGQKQAAIPLYQEAISLFRQYDLLSPYLKAAVNNLRSITPPLQARLAKTDMRLKALAEVSGIQAVDRNIILKGRATDMDNANLLREEKATNSVTEAHIKKTVLQAFVKMTCLETAELGSNYYTAADRYLPLRADGKNIAVPASSGFNAPIISIKLNGQSYNVGVDLPELSASRRTVYLVTDGKNVLAIDPATYDVWKLYSRLDKHSAEFDWHKLTHQKDFQRRINQPKVTE